MVGEIRDTETAQIAIQASLTGHLVLSTVHTNSAVGAITRLRDMGIESFLISSSLKTVISQRLVRRLCDSCKVKTTINKDIADLFGLSTILKFMITRAVINVMVLDTKEELLLQSA